MLVTATLGRIGRCPCVLAFAIPFGVACRADVRALQSTDGPFGGPSTQRLTVSSRHHAEPVCTIASGELKSGISFHPIDSDYSGSAVVPNIADTLSLKSQGCWMNVRKADGASGSYRTHCLCFHRWLIRWLTAPLLSQRTDGRGPHRSDSRAIFPR